MFLSDRKFHCCCVPSKIPKFPGCRTRLASAVLKRSQAHINTDFLSCLNLHSKGRHTGSHPVTTECPEAGLRSEVYPGRVFPVLAHSLRPNRKLRSKGPISIGFFSILSPDPYSCHNIFTSSSRPVISHRMRESGIGPADSS